MKILDIFKKRKPNHLIIYVDYKRRELLLYKILSKLTYSVGPYIELDKVERADDEKIDDEEAAACCININ